MNFFYYTNNKEIFIHGKLSSRLNRKKPFSFIYNPSVSALMGKLSEACLSSHKSNVSKVTFSRLGVTMHIT